MEARIICPECGALLELRAGPAGVFYGCTNWPKCDVTQRADDDGRPLGIPSNGPTKRARILAHLVFDRLWTEGHMTRDGAYFWMQDIMGLTSEQAHISKFNSSQCNALMRAVNVFLERDGHLINPAAKKINIEKAASTEEEWDNVVNDMILEEL